MAGAYYIWIMAAFFLGCGGILLLLVGLLFLGHYLEKKETGATHGFLELPTELQSPPPASSSSQTEPADASPAPPPPPSTS